MKLLLLFLGLLSCCFLLQTEKEKDFSGQENTRTEVVISPTQFCAEFPAITTENNWLKTYFLILKVLNPVKQLDYPGDYKSWPGAFYKLLHSFSENHFATRQKLCYTSKYMRLLSVRHSDGFYVYSFGKLII